MDVSGCVVPLSSQVKILRVTLDSHVTFDKYVVDICKACSFHMHAFRHIRPCLTDDVAKTIASALVSSRLDYADAVLVGVSDKNITKLQRTQNTLARIVTRKCESRGITKSLKYLHWLPVKWRIDYKIALTTYIRNIDATYNSLRPVVPATRTVISNRAFPLAEVVGLDQSWLKKELDIRNIVMILILFCGIVFHYYIHDVIIIIQTYGSSI